MTAQLICAEESCGAEATVMVEVSPRFEACPPIEGWYIDMLRRNQPAVPIHFHEGGHLSATIRACSSCVGDLVGFWSEWLYGEYDPVIYQDPHTDEELQRLGWTIHADGRMEHGPRRVGAVLPSPQQSIIPAPVAGGSGNTVSRHRSSVKRAARKRSRQDRKRGRS